MTEIPLNELMEKLSQYDEVTLLEMLEVDSTQLLYYLRDIVVEKQDELREQLQEEEEDDE